MNVKVQVDLITAATREDKGEMLGAARALTDAPTLSMLPFRKKKSGLQWNLRLQPHTRKMCSIKSGSNFEWE
uniref:Uncharacterized protein n=1 Tax=Candidatus Kentrum sp. DK TaxID=2126562 RepID=A0A450T4J9_9GAMM|nr:MAG: hypothetical protein BECKDK2373B_GA0170837_11004 [Candidatus Kentron sp. DK]